MYILNAIKIFFFLLMLLKNINVNVSLSVGYTCTISALIPSHCTAAVMYQMIE